MYTFKISCIDYDISEEDVEDILLQEYGDSAPIDEAGDVHFDAEVIDNKYSDILWDLPDTIIVEIDEISDVDDLEDKLSDAISEKTGWLVNGFDYELLDRVHGTYKNGN